MSVHECQQDDALLRRAWHRGIAEASKHALDVAQRVRRSELELLPAFTTHYQTLQTLPRRTRRSLQRRWKRSLPALALLLALGQMPALAATINVGGTCNLVRAINAANNDTTAGGNCTKGSGADSIVLPANSTQTLTTINNTADGPIGLPVIGSVVSIDGNGSTIRRASGAPAFESSLWAHGAT